MVYRKAAMALSILFVSILVPTVSADDSIVIDLTPLPSNETVDPILDMLESPKIQPGCIPLAAGWNALCIEGECKDPEDNTRYNCWYFACNGGPGSCVAAITGMPRIRSCYEGMGYC